MSTQYGTTLIVKLALVLGAAVLGAINRFIVMPGRIPAFHTRDARVIESARRFTLILRIEATVLFGVLMVAVLSATSPLTTG